MFAFVSSTSPDSFKELSLNDDAHGGSDQQAGFGQTVAGDERSNGAW